MTTLLPIVLLITSTFDTQDWDIRLMNVLKFLQTKYPSNDRSLFLKHENNHFIILLLHQHFCIKILGDLTYFLGLEVACIKTGIHLSQRKYTLDWLQEVGILNCAPTYTPMDPSFHTKNLGTA